ncbi:fibulin-1-like isoform X2 [Daktulosphaira vitifoliae]|nr:fibulin-1-like isoform X2 [Daktulosphaira vitifoliae]
MNSLREMRCLEGKIAALSDGSCDEKTELGKSQVDFMMCCELCKIGMLAKVIQNTCKLMNLFIGSQWNELYLSCCNAASDKMKPSPLVSLKMSIKKETDPCSSGIHNCSRKEKCVSIPNGYKCVPYSTPLPIPLSQKNLRIQNQPRACDPGFAFDIFSQKCIDVDECSELPCETNELCENTIGSFICHCKNGFQQDKITNACTDINECQLNLHECGESQRCDNTVGSYQCVRFTGCGTGYTLDIDSAMCVDDDECLLKTDSCGLLGPEYICRNTLGSFRCERKRSCIGPNCNKSSSLPFFNNTMSYTSNKCLRGYEKDDNNQCKDINECSLSNRCTSNEMCINTNGSYYCLPKSRNNSNF